MIELNKKNYRAKDGAAVYAIAIGACMLLQIYIAVTIGIANIKEDTYAYKITSNLATLFIEIGFLAVYIAYNKYNKSRPQIAVKFKIQWRWYALAVMFSLVCLICFYPVAAAFSLFLDKIGFENPPSFEAGGAFNNITLFAAAVVAAPIAEELIFRGALLSGLSTRFKHIAAAALCAVAFSFMHMNPAQTVFQFFLGLAACSLAFGSKSVVPPMILHFCNNLIAFLLTLGNKYKAIEPFQKPINAYENFLDHPAALALCSVFLTALGLAAILFPFKKAQKSQQENEQDKSESKPFNIMFFGTLGFCAFIWLTVLV